MSSVNEPSPLESAALNVAIHASLNENNYDQQETLLAAANAARNQQPTTVDVSDAQDEEDRELQLAMQLSLEEAPDYAEMEPPVFRSSRLYATPSPNAPSPDSLPVPIWAQAGSSSAAATDGLLLCGFVRRAAAFVWC